MSPCSLKLLLSDYFIMPENKLRQSLPPLASCMAGGQVWVSIPDSLPDSAW